MCSPRRSAETNSSGWRNSGQAKARFSGRVNPTGSLPLAVVGQRQLVAGIARLARFLLFVCLLASGFGTGEPAQAEINPPLGPYVNLVPADFEGASIFSTNEPLVLTDYFYWYDIGSNMHIIDGDVTDALTDHPATMAGFSYKSNAWHKSQLADMMSAGIDFLAAVFWGAPSERDPATSGNYWSFSGLTPLV